MKSRVDSNDRFFVISNFLFFSALFLLSFVFFNILVSSIGFILKISITKWSFFLSMIFSVTLNIIYCGKKNIFITLFSIIVPLLIIFLAINLNAKFYDYTWDGNSYHKSTIGMMMSGWNPVYENMEEFDYKSKFPIGVKDNSYIWGNHYAKASHIFAANIGVVTGKIESGKSINTISIMMLFFLSLSILLYNTKKIFPSVLLCICFITCPTISSQLLTNYVDLLVYIYFFTTILLFFAFEKFDLFQNSKTKLLVPFLMTLVIAINIKFSLFAYAGIYCLGYYLWYLIRLKNNAIDKKFFILFTICSSLAVIIGVFVVGLSVYPKNFIKKGNPFYPLMGDGKIDIMTVNQPDYFKKKSPINKFVIATFSKSANISEASGLKANYKIPFSVYKSEFDVQYACDLRISGNGMLFGGIIIISFLALIFVLKDVYENDRVLFYLIAIPCFITTLLIFTLGESWWARYFPQLHLLVFFPLLLLMINNKRMLNFLFIILSVIVLCNNYIVLHEAFRNVLDYKQEVDNQFKSLENQTNPNSCVLDIYTSSFHGSLYNIIERESTYKIVIASEDEYKEKYDYSGGLMGAFAVWKCKNDIDVEV